MPKNERRHSERADEGPRPSRRARPRLRRDDRMGLGSTLRRNDSARRHHRLRTCVRSRCGHGIPRRPDLCRAHVVAVSRGRRARVTYAGIGPRAAYVCGWALVLAYSTVVAFEVVSLPTVAGYVVTGLNTGYLYTIAGWDLHLPGSSSGSQVLSGLPSSTTSGSDCRRSFKALLPQPSFW